MEVSPVLEPVATKPKLSIIVLATLIILAILIGGFYIWNTIKTGKEVVDSTPSPVANNQSTSTPDATIATWSTFKNKPLKFSFKLAPLFSYPTEIDPTEGNIFSNKQDLSGPREISGSDVLLESTIYTSLDDDSIKKVDTGLSSAIGAEVEQPFQPIGGLKKLTNLSNGGAMFEESPMDTKEVTYYISIWKNGNNVHVLKMFALPDVIQTHKTIFEQMSASYNFNI